jgi:outer membrane protein TolC
MKKKLSTKLLFTGMLACSLIISVQVSSGLTIDEAVTQALENNPDLQKQEMNKALSEDNLTGKKSQNFGKIDMVASYGHYNLPRTLVPLTPAAISVNPASVPTTQDLFTTGIMYEVPLFTGFSQKQSVEIAKLDKRIAGLAIKLSREQLIYNVKSLYVNILSLNAQETAQREYYTALERLHNDIEMEVKLGKKARVDQLKAAADLENAKMRLGQIRGNTQILRSSLATLINGDVVGTLDEFTMEMTAPDGIDCAEDMTGLGRYRSAELDVEKKSRLVDKSKAAFYPQIVFNGFYGQNFGPNDSSNSSEGDWNHEEAWQAIVNLKWTLFDFGSRKTSKEIAHIRQQQSRKTRIATELELKKLLREATTKISLALDEFHSAEAELALTSETARIEQIRFEKGAADVNDLLYARARDQLAASRSITARYNYQSSRFYLDYLLEKGENK